MKTENITKEGTKSDKVKFIFTVIVLITISLLVYYLTLYFLEEYEIEWYYPMLASIIILLGFITWYYIYTSKLEQKIIEHCEIPTNKKDDICKP